MREVRGPLRPGLPGPDTDNAYAPGHPRVADGEYLQVRDYLRILNRRRWIIIGILVAGVLAAAVHNWRTTPIFEARTTLHLEADTNVLALDRPLVDSRDWMREFLPTQLGIMASRDVAQRAAEELMKGTAEADGSAPLPAAADPEVPSIQAIAAGRSLSVDRDTRIVRVGFRSTDPELAARVANALASAYIQKSIELKSHMSGEASQWLEGQLEQQRKVVQASEQALQRYREQHGADALVADRLGTERQNIVVQKLGELQTETTRARAETIDKEAQYRQLAALAGNPAAASTLPAVASNAVVQRLKAELTTLQQQLTQAAQQLGERHPEMIKLQIAVRNAEAELQTEIASVVQSIRNEFEAAQARERALTAALTRQRGEVQALNAKAVEYTALQHEAASNREVLDKLLQRSSEATLARQLQTSNARIIDVAEVPAWPVLPRKNRNLMLAAAGSGFLALGLVFLLEIFNTRLTSPDDVKRHLGVQVIGVTPQVKGMNGHGGPLLSHGAPPQFAELLHGVRTSLVLAPGLSEARTLLVTSSEPGEGKSMAAANLAVSLARLKQRVLLIDADLRRPKLHDLFGTEQQPGLTDVLTGRATHTAVRKTKVPHLWLMPAGVAARNPADIIGSERFGVLVDCLREQFDWVVLDSPPVMAVTDPCLIARVASGVLFVVASNHTPREVARAAVDQLEAVGANIVGVLLNRAALDKPGESYLPYYHRDYRYYAQPDGNGWIPTFPGPQTGQEAGEEVASVART
jgi:polysaccharide biosynthesis transport protein